MLASAIKRDIDAAREKDERLQTAVQNERVKRQARRIVDAEEQPLVEIPALEVLSDALSLPELPLEYRVEALQPVETRVVLAAQFKSGKTTLRDNYVRSLVDGDPFLGRYRVTPITGTVAIVDVEMSRRQLVAWWREQSIRRTDRVRFLSMRGKAGAFDIFTAAGRRVWVERFKAAGVVYLIIDCARPIMDAFRLDENKDAGRLLDAIDALMTESGIPEGMVIHHMGHTGERSRGDSRWRDWPDVEWRLVRKDDDPSSPRFISAYGRDVDVPEQELAYDAATRRLGIVGGSRRDAVTHDALEAVVGVLGASGDPQSGRAIKRKLEGSIPREAVEAALRVGSANGRLTRENGPRNATLYRLSPAVSGVSADCPADGVSECPAAYIKPDTRTVTRTDDGERSGRTLEGMSHVDRI
jgi:hypothetical protein